LNRKDVTSPHYYTAWAEGTVYHEGDDTDFPDSNSSRLYELVQVGYDSVTGKYMWNFYYATLAYHRNAGDVEISGTALMEPLYGGEVNSTLPGKIPVSGTEMAIPSHVRATTGQYRNLA
jgi:hypothetical protein